MYLSNRVAATSVLACTLAAVVACRSEPRSQLALGAELAGTAWLGSAEEWGLLGLPRDGGQLTYRRAATLESPTWAPPELERLAGAWQADNAIWLQFWDSRVGRYEYATGHLLAWEGKPQTDRALAPHGQRWLAIVTGGRTLELVGRVEPWRLEFDAPIVRLEDAGRGRIVAVLDGDSGDELVVLEPPDDTVLARRRVGGVGELEIIGWGERLYYLAGGDADTVVRGLSLPALEDVEEIQLPEPARALAATPSGHRLYVAAGESILVFDRLRGERVRAVAMSEPVSALRFAITGASLMARLGAGNRIAVLRVGIDSVLGVIDSEWDEDLPVVVPGGRLVARIGSELILYDASSLVELARAEVAEGQRWFAVKWQPPRPRQEPERFAREGGLAVEAVPASGPVTGEAEGVEPETGAPPGYYAVVSAARERSGVEALVTWLRDVGYPGVVDRHEDVMGKTWYRAMVGPYEGRAQAEEVAHSLGARYGYKPWILSPEGPDEAAGRSESQADGEANPEEGVAEPDTSEVRF